MNLNDFYFTGIVASIPETRVFQTSSKTSFLVEQTTHYKDLEKKTTLTINVWHKGESHSQSLTLGDNVLVKGKFSSSPYKDRFIMNLDAAQVVMLGNQIPSEQVPF